MNKLSNKVQLIGHLGQDPEVIQFEDGNQLTKFSLATNEVYKNAKGEKVEDTQWHDVVMRGKLSEIAAEYLSKGKQVAVEGKLVHRSYESKEGEKRYVTEVHAYEMKLF